MMKKTRMLMRAVTLVMICSIHVLTINVTSLGKFHNIND